jgi:hypothetical protein
LALFQTLVIFQHIWLANSNILLADINGRTIMRRTESRLGERCVSTATRRQCFCIGLGVFSLRGGKECIYIITSVKVPSYIAARQRMVAKLPTTTISSSMTGHGLKPPRSRHFGGLLVQKQYRAIFQFSPVFLRTKSSELPSLLVPPVAWTV